MMKRNSKLLRTLSVLAVIALVCLGLALHTGTGTPSAAFTAPPNAANAAAAPQNPANARRVYAAMAYAAWALWPIIWSSSCRKPSVMSATPR